MSLAARLAAVRGEPDPRPATATPSPLAVRPRPRRPQTRTPTPALAIHLFGSLLQPARGFQAMSPL
jgi:hypothetical protein